MVGELSRPGPYRGSTPSPISEPARSPSSSAWCPMRALVRRASCRVALTARACGTGGAAQLLRQRMQARGGSSSGHRPSMTASEHVRFEPRERCHRLFREGPVPGRVPWRAPYSRPAPEQAPHGIEVDRQDRVAGDEHPVAGAEERGMSRRVTRGGDASPVRQAGRWPGRIQRAGNPCKARLGGQAGTQAPDPMPVSSQNRGSRAGSTIHSLPADSAATWISWPRPGQAASISARDPPDRIR